MVVQHVSTNIKINFSPYLRFKITTLIKLTFAVYITFERKLRKTETNQRLLFLLFFKYIHLRKYAICAH